MKRFGFHESPVLASRPAFWRARLVVIMLMLGFAALAAKALNLQILSNEFLQRQGERRYERTLVLPASRGKILDRSGSVVLASSVPAKAVWAIPEDFHKASDAQVSELARLLDVKPAELRQRTQDEDKNFVYLQRQVAVDKASRASGAMPVIPFAYFATSCCMKWLASRGMSSRRSSRRGRVRVTTSRR